MSYPVTDRKVSERRRAFSSKAGPRWKQGHYHREKAQGTLAAPCLQPYLIGSNILRDAGFESGGDNASFPNRVPQWDVTPNVSYPDIAYYDRVGGTAHTPAYTTTLGWTADFDWSDRYHEYSTAAPRSGTYHLRSQTYGETTVWDAVWAVGGYRCVQPTTTGPDMYSAVVNPGDVITWGIWSRRTGTSATLEANFIMSIWDDTETNLGFFGSALGTLSTSYQYYETIQVMPASAKYLQCGFDADIQTGTPSSDTRIYYDDAVLGVA